MEKILVKKTSEKLKIQEKNIEAVASLLGEGSTIAFIARYRKEKTGSLDEVDITKIKETLGELEILEKRKEAVIKSITEQELLTNQIEQNIRKAETLSELEDIYLPFKPKKRTKASIAKEKGLLALANKMVLQINNFDPKKDAEKFINPDKGVKSVDDAIEGAKYIIAEMISENTNLRGEIRTIFEKDSIIESRLVKTKKDEAVKFKDYFDFSQPVKKCPGHRILAIFRGNSLGYLKISIKPDDEKPLRLIKRIYLKNSPSSPYILEAIEDSYKRLILPSMETEQKNRMKDESDLEAVDVFASNLKELLMAAPLGPKRILAIDPGLRTGCKAVILDEKGDLIDNFLIFPFEKNKKENAEKTIISNIEKFNIEAIAVGNGTAGRETEAFVKNISGKIPVILTDESGASIYSASTTAREEFPNHDLTVRGAVSIGRRLMDPLAELVKIDPKSIGVGQYQHDVNQKLLKSKLDNVVISCVNQVGVDLNLASRELISYVSGVGPKMADNIIKFRLENGKFKKRSDLKKVPKLGPKTFEQCAGFLKIPDGKNRLDSSSVHPESYKIVEKMAKDLSCSIDQLMKDSDLRKKIELKNYISEKTGLPTLQDIMDELAKPGRDPRDAFEIFSFKKGINKITDLEIGMKLPGIVTNVTKFGAFVDVGVHQDGLVHISQLSQSFVKDPADVVKPRQKVMVKVVSIEENTKRIGLSMKEA